MATLWGHLSSSTQAGEHESERYQHNLERGNRTVAVRSPSWERQGLWLLEKEKMLSII